MFQYRDHICTGEVVNSHRLESIPVTTEQFAVRKVKIKLADLSRGSGWNGETQRIIDININTALKIEDGKKSMISV